MKSEIPEDDVDKFAKLQEYLEKLIILFYENNIRIIIYLKLGMSMSSYNAEEYAKKLDYTYGDLQAELALNEQKRKEEKRIITLFIFIPIKI